MLLPTGGPLQQIWGLILEFQELLQHYWTYIPEILNGSYLQYSRGKKMLLPTGGPLQQVSGLILGFQE